MAHQSRIDCQDHSRESKGSARAVIIYADSERDANMLYATRFFVPDPFLYVRTSRKRYVIISEMERSRAKREAEVDEVYSYSDVYALQGQKRRSPVNIAEVCSIFLGRMGIGKAEVPRSFPTGLAEDLRRKGLRIDTRPDPFFLERSVKSRVEVDHIREALRAAEHGMKAARDALRASRIDWMRKGRLTLSEEPLTAERMRILIHKAILEKSCQASHTIVSCGTQGYDPHQRGEGVLYGNQPIIVDIFPRSETTGYCGDLTRTWVKGKASARVRQMHSAVRRAQDLAVSLLSPGIQANRVHRLLLQSFRDWGFPTEAARGQIAGFIHGTGHGLGLEVHEHPSIGERKDRLAEGNVVTVEPGLYYPDVGGVRIEDVVWVTRGGPKVLSRFPKGLDIA